MHSETQRSVLIAGGRGFIGRAVVKVLRRTGYPVTSLDRSALPEISSGDSGEEVCCDLTDANWLRDLFERIQIGTIIHLAAILPTAAQRSPVLATQVNVQGSLNLLEMARLFRVRRFLFGSSLSIYGTYPAGRAVSECDPAAPEDLYGAAKLYVEQLGRAYHETYGLDFVSLRIGRVVGAGANSVSSAWRSEIFELLKVNRPAEICIPYRPSENILVAHVEDIASMFLTMLRAARTEYAAYNAPCEPIEVEDLKHVVESLNSNLTIRLGDGTPAGNPQALDLSRFRNEFKFESVPIFDRLKKAAAR